MKLFKRFITSVVMFTIIFVLAIATKSTFSQASVEPCAWLPNTNFSTISYLDKTTPGTLPTDRNVSFVGITPDENNWLIDVSGERDGIPTIVQLPLAGFDRSSFEAAVPDCDIPMWGVPETPPITISELLTEQNIVTNWHEAGFRGQNVRVGVIDTRFEEILTLPGVIHVPDILSLTEYREESLATDYDHGTNVLRIIRAIAPEATLFAARAVTAEEFSAAVDAMVALNVQIIVHAGNVITPDPTPYHDAVRRATNAGLLWINSAGNIGAGYYASTYNGDTGAFAVNNFHQFTDPNRDNSRSLMVPVNTERGVTVTLLWDAPTDESPVTDFDLRVAGSILIQNEPFELVRVNLDQVAGQPTVETAFVSADQWQLDKNYDSTSLRFFTDQFDIPDNLTDNEVYIHISPSYEQTINGIPPVQFGVPFEIYVEGALAAEYDPTITRSLAPVVLVPGDLREVLTVGAYNPHTDALTWYSSRSNLQQFADSGGVVKPDISTYGDIMIADQLFSGTSASTPVIGGIAVLLTSFQGVENFNAAQIRNLIENYNVQCMEDEVAGSQLSYLQLLSPSLMNSRVNDNLQTICGTLEFEPDITNPDPLLGQRAEISAPAPGAVVTGSLQIEGTVNGSNIDGYTLEIAPAPSDGTEPTAWQLIPGFATSIENPPSDLCSVAGQLGLPSGSIENGRIYLFETDNYIDQFPDGEYFIRLRLCSDGSVNNETRVRITLQNEVSPIIQVISPTLANSTVSDTLILQGIAQGRGFERYVVQIAPHGTQEWLAIVPENVEIPADQCSALPTPPQQGTVPVREQGILAFFDTTQLEDGYYDLRLTLCVSDVLPDYVTLIENILVDNEQLPVPVISSPINNDEINTSTGIRGNASGEGFVRYILTLTPIDGSSDAIILVPADAGTTDLTAICAIPTEQNGDGATEVSGTELYRFNPQDTEDGEYILQLYVCTQSEIIPSAPISVSIITPEIPQTLFVLNQPSDTLSGRTASFFGSVSHPNLVGYTLEIIDASAAEDPEATWLPIVPVITPDNIPEDLCAFAEESTGGSNIVLATLDTTGYANGDYVARLRLCTDPAEEGLEFRIPFSINNPPVVDVQLPVADQTYSDNLAIIGSVGPINLQQYTVEIEPVDELEETSWTTLVGPQIPEGEIRPDDLCSLTPDIASVYGLRYVDNDLLAQAIDTTTYATGVYRLRVRVCLDNVFQDEAIVQFTIDNQSPPQLEVTSPEAGEAVAPAPTSLSILGSAFGEGVQGYTVEIAQNEINPTWTVIFPQEITDTAGASACTAESFPFVAAVRDGVLHTFDTTEYPDGEYLLRISLCVLKADGLVTAEIERTRSIIIRNDNFIVDFSAVAFTDRINLVGTITVPNFEQYIVEIAPDFEEQTEFTWLPIVAPNFLNDRGQSASELTADERCAFIIPEGNLGSVPVENGTLGVFQQNAFAPGTYQLRITVCRGEDEPFERIISNFVTITPGSLGIEGGPTVTSLISPSATIRNGPGQEYSIVGELEEGSSAALIGRTVDNTWFNILFEDLPGGGWISATQVFIHMGNFDISSLPIVSGPLTTSAQNVLFASDVTGQWQIYRTDLDGTNVVQLTFEGNNEFPDTSPSGELVVFASDRDGNQEIYVMNTDGSNVTNLTNSPNSNEYRPSWSPDGETILFESDQAGERNLYALTVATGNIVQLTNGGVPCCVDWATNGRQIVFAAIEGGNYEIFVANLDGARLVNITNSSGNDINPSWQPNGTAIVFQSDRSGSNQIYRVQIDGTGLQQLTFTETDNIDPSWLLNGTQIIFSSARNGTLDLFVMNADGSNEQPIIDDQGAQAGGESD